MPRASCRLLLASFGLWLTACGGASTNAPDAETARQKALEHVQFQACLVPAMSNSCVSDRSIRFGTWAQTAARTRVGGKIWCENGQPHAEFVTVGSGTKGTFGQPVWEAIWRVAGATHACAAAFEAPIVISIDGHEKTCPHPDFNMQSLLAMAYRMAKTGPPRRETGEELQEICKIDPDACPKIVNDPCPPFTGDAWNGVRRPEPVVDLDEKDEPAVPSAKPDTTDSEATPGPPPSRPSQGEIVRVLGALLPEAKRCLHSDTTLAKVNVHFGSEGHVAQVDVRDAKGSEAECIKKVFRKAQVRPFSDATYVSNLTVRR